MSNIRRVLDRGGKRRDRIQELAAVAARYDADFLQIIRREARQNVRLDRILAKGRLVLAGPQIAWRCIDVRTASPVPKGIIRTGRQLDQGGRAQSFRGDTESVNVAAPKFRDGDQNRERGMNVTVGPVRGVRNLTSKKPLFGISALGQNETGQREMPRPSQPISRCERASRSPPERRSFAAAWRADRANTVLNTVLTVWVRTALAA